MSVVEKLQKVDDAVLGGEPRSSEPARGRRSRLAAVVAAAALAGAIAGLIVLPLSSRAWEQITAVGMLLGVVLFAVAARRVHQEDAHTPVLHLFACAAGVLGYVAIATDRGLVRDGEQLASVPHGVYLLVSMPLIALSLITLALRGPTDWAETRPRTTLVGGLLGAITVWNVAALAQSLTADSQQRWVWYGLGLAALLAALFLVFGPVLADVRDKNALAVDAYLVLAGTLAALWIGQELTYTLGHHGLELWGYGGDVVAQALLDLGNDVVYGVLTLAVLHRLSSRRRPRPGQSTSEALAEASEDPYRSDPHASTSQNASQ